MITFIIPVYNTRIELIHRAVDSVLAQGSSDWELIIVDDGSKESVAQEIDLTAKSDERIKVFHQRNQGVCVARNTGIAAACGDYVAFVDADDWLSLDYIQAVEKYLEGEKPDLLAFGHSDHYGETQVQRLHSTPEFLVYAPYEKKYMEFCLLNEKSTADRYSMFFGAPWNILYRREFLNKFNIYYIPGLKKSEDAIFNLYAVEQADKICYLNKVLYHYFKNPESVTHSYQPEYQHVCGMLMERRKFIEQYHSQEPEFYDVFYYGCIIVFDGLCGLKFFHPDNQDPLPVRKKELRDMLNGEPYSTMLREINPRCLTKFKKVQVIAMKKGDWNFLKLLFKLKMLKNRRH